MYSSSNATMKLVQFSNGKFGIRKGFWPLYTYFDFTIVSPNKIFWPKSSIWFKDCQVCEVRARDILAILNSKDKYRKHYITPKKKEKVTDTVIHL